MAALQEGRSLAQISHPSVVSVLNFFRENETVYMVMNYLQGDTLQDFIVTARVSEWEAPSGAGGRQPTTAATYVRIGAR